MVKISLTVSIIFRITTAYQKDVGSHISLATTPLDFVADPDPEFLGNGIYTTAEWHQMKDFCGDFMTSDCFSFIMIYFMVFEQQVGCDCYTRIMAYDL